MTSVLIVGTGVQGKRHLASLNELGMRVDGIVDIDPAARAYADKRGITAFERLEDIRGLERFDIVDICLPSRVMSGTALSAIEHGARRVILEKPVASSLSDLLALKQKAEQRGILCAVCENYRYSSLTALLMQQIAELQDDIVAIRSDFSKNRIADTMRWRGTLPNAENHILEIEIPHQVAVVGQVMADKEATDIKCNIRDLVVGATGNDHTFRNMAECEVFISFGNSVNCSLSSNLVTDPPRRTFSVESRNYILQLDYGQTGHFTLLDRRTQEPRLRKEIHEDSLREALRVISNALLHDESPPTDLPFGMRILDIIERAKTSSNRLPPLELRYISH